MATEPAYPRPGIAEVVTHRSDLVRFCARMLGPGEAEDAVQETLIRAWRSVERFEGRAPLRAWLYRIATNVCLDMLEARKRRARPIDLGRLYERGADDRLAPACDPEEVAVHRDFARAVSVALRQLPPRQRAVLILRDVLRWQASEVAELLGTSVAAVNSALQRARATLHCGPDSVSLDLA
jgi:RNA polymerase sigma-70 factor (ECF subfamily)